MSRNSRSPTNSPSLRLERAFRSSTIGAISSSSNPDLTSIPINNARNSVLLSENQLNRISRQLENIRHGSSPLPNSQRDENESIFQESPVSINAPSESRNSNIFQHRVGDFSIQIQEYAMIEDLLYVLIAVEGSYVKCIYPKAIREEEDLMDDIRSHISQSQENGSWDAMKYDIDPTLDPSLKHLVEKILPLATYYMSIDAFIDQYSRFEYGTINHALCAGMRVFLKEYLTFVAQLEHEFQTSPSFTLQRLWFYAQDLLQSMKIIHDLAMAIRSINTSRTPKEEEEEENNIEAVIEGLQQEESNEVQISEKQKGGAILNILSERLIGLSGDPKCKKIYTFLLSKASVPYFEILHSWIYHGEIKDPYNEFMVLEKKSVKKENLKEDYNDTYWETRYTIREGGVPVFLDPMKDQILLAGKFLNVVRECGVSIANSEEMQSEVLGHNIVQELRLDGPAYAATRQAQQQQRRHEPPSNIPARSEVWAAVDGTRFVKNLEVAYKYANQTLLNLLMKDQQLIGRLRSLKHYFFLDQSDFLTSFLDLAKAELKQPASEIPQTRLQSLMDLVLRNPSSVAAYDPFKEDVKVSMSHLRLIDQLLRIINVSGMDAAVSSRRSTLSAGGLVDTSAFERSQSLSGSFMSTASAFAASSREPLTGYDALILDYTVTFPLSLVISRKALTKYQLLFRHILNMKHVEDLLCGAWMDQKNRVWKTRSSNPEIEHWKFRVYSLRNRMLTFVQQFAYYVTNEVLEPNWHRLESNLTSISTVDQVLQYHSDFLDTCLKECMLTNSKLLRIFNKLMGSCVAFTTQAEKYNSLLMDLEEEQAVDRFGIPKSGLADTSSVRFVNTNRSLTKIEESFQYHMKLLIDALNFYSAQETAQFLCLVVRLDYNQFYNNALINTRDSRSSSRQR